MVKIVMWSHSFAIVAAAEAFLDKISSSICEPIHLGTWIQNIMLLQKRLLHGRSCTINHHWFLWLHHRATFQMPQVESMWRRLCLRNNAIILPVTCQCLLDVVVCSKKRAYMKRLYYYSPLLSTFFLFVVGDDPPPHPRDPTNTTKKG